MTGAAFGVEVDQIDQLAHRVQAVADDLRRLAPGGGDQLVTDDQQAEIAAGQEFFHHHLAMLGGGAVGDVDVVAGGDVDRHALALVAVLRLEHHWQAELQGGGPGVVRVGHGAAQRHRHTGGAQQFFRQILVLRDGLGDGAGAVQLGGLDAALARAPAELHHAALGQTPKWNAARHGGFDNRAGARPHALVFIEIAQLGQRRFERKSGLSRCR